MSSKLSRKLGRAAIQAAGKWNVDTRATGSGEHRDQATAVGDAVLSVLSTLAEDGWKLVPVEATPEMLDAVWSSRTFQMRGASDYRELVAAAPALTQEQNQ